MTITFGSLFAGIGGLDLGLERAGMQCRWQVELDPYATRVLARHWPNVRRWDDVCTFPPDARDCCGHWHVDLICGGFPCQDISYAGRGAGLSGKRSGLFFEFMRVVSVLGPRYVLLENVAALLTRGLDQVLGTLASLGYDAEWHCIPAAAVGAPHIRDRIFIIGYMADATQRGQSELRGTQRETGLADGSSEDLENTSGWRRKHRRAKSALINARKANTKREGVWSTEPDVGRVAYGVPARVDRLRCLGNAVVPQVAEYVAHKIIAIDTGRKQ